MWTGLVLGILGLVVWLSGTQHLTTIDTVEGGTAWERQLIQAFASGGLEYGPAAALPDPASVDDPAAAAAALEQIKPRSANEMPLKPRVNTGAVDPCPT